MSGKDKLPDEDFCIPTTPHKLVKSLFVGDPPRRKKSVRRKKSAKK